ncbi:hypothetical protein L6164_017680 [Bauhinia variegata]|uniref:Uncharacterized protein n=1 Tax=Bauhinia variegata TaxID=167791 RepID=A0ACB9N8P7_BAUVA|nr:hypothetical protein L6164_017680 [Bauhinia variegata]
MAAAVLPTSQTEQCNGRVTIYVVLSCMVAAMGALLYGYDSGISGGVTSMESFQKKFFPEVYRKEEEDTETSNYCKFDSQLLTAFTSSLYIAGCFTSFLASHITGTFGRKPSIVAGGVTFLAGGILCGSAVNVYMLIIGRLLLGVGVGFANQSVPFFLQAQEKTMTVGVDAASPNGQHKGRITLFVVLSCMTAAMGGLIYGYDTGGATSMESFLKESFPKVYEKDARA